MTAQFESHTFRYGDYTLAYELHGPEDGLPCLLMHGLLLDSLLNRDLARRFARRGYRVVLLDILGHGKSDRPTDPRELRIDFFAAHGWALLDHLGIERALIGGVSLGAITALQMMDTQPERCLGLFLEMPVMEWSTTFAALLLVPLIGMIKWSRPLLRRFSRGLRRVPRPRHETLASLMNAASSEPETVEAVLHGILVGPVVPPSERRRMMDVPALVIGHGRDGLHELQDAIALAEELPQGELMQAKWIGELRVSPGRMWPRIEAFLDSVRSANGRRPSDDEQAVAP